MGIRVVVPSAVFILTSTPGFGGIFYRESHKGFTRGHPELTHLKQNFPSLILRERPQLGGQSCSQLTWVLFAVASFLGDMDGEGTLSSLAVAASHL